MQTGKQRVRWGTLLLAFLMCFALVTQGTFSTSAASYSNANLRRLAEYIDANGTTDEDGTYLPVLRYYEEYIYYFRVQDQAEGMLFSFMITEDASDRVVTLTELLLKENSNYASVDFTVAYYINNNIVDGASTTKSINKTTHTSNSTYSVYASGSYYISSSDVSTLFNSSLQLLCTFWDSYIYTALGFGLKGIGFTSYDGAGADCTSHTYDNSCDTTCNNCGETRVVNHTYSGSCDTSCNVCGSSRTVSVSHTYDNSKDPSCNVCGADRVVVEEDTSATLYSGTCGANLTWRLTKNGTLYISGTGNMYNYSSNSSAPWDAYDRYIKRVVIEEGVTSIGNYAFYFSGYFESVSIPSTVTKLGEDCFNNCDSLRQVVLPSGIRTIPKFAFYSCDVLETIVIPSSVQSFGQGCFNGCSSLQYFIIPDGVREIAYSMFWHCSSLEYVQIPSSVTSIDSFAFHECGNLSDIYFTGSSSQWRAIEVSSLESYNEGLLYATVHYNSKAPCTFCTYGAWTSINTSSHQHTCTNCGNKETASHTWDSGKVTKQPTCAATGVMTYTCTVCNGTKTETIAKTTDHTYGKWSKVDGTVHQHTCSVCNTAEFANHYWDQGMVTQQPTCAATGVMTYTCEDCGGTMTEPIAKTTDHTYGKWSKVDDNTHKHTCTVCNAAESANHHWDEGVVTKQPTCAATGVKTYTCTDCGGTKTETIAKTNDHTYGEWTKVEDTNHSHKCSLCGKIETTAHKWDSGKITLMPTLDTTGLREHTCVDCGATKTEVVPKRANGDLDGDMEINNKDVEYLLWYTLFPESYPLEIFADFDGSGTVDNKDVEYLLWHTLFPESYPL